MNRKDFIKNSILGTGIFVTGSKGIENVKNEIDEIQELNPVQFEKEILGFNHINNTKSSLMNNSVLHKAASRGHANHGWLNSYHTFSFANYYNPERMHFGVLRVLNDDTVSGGKGFGTHPHDNMEIISIPLEGDLEHKDSMGNIAVIKNGDVQIMSAGSGITHSEYNKNQDNMVKFLQIWVYPNKKNVAPRYDQITLKEEDRRNKLQQILSPNSDDEGVWIHQNAWFHLGKLDNNVQTTYKVHDPSNGIYVFMINGDVAVNEVDLNARDGFGIWNVDSINIRSKSENAELLIMEVPMQA